MKIVMDVPKEFEKDFSADRFKEFFERVCADMTGNGCCGRYERETAEMLKNAFQKAEVSSEETAWVLASDPQQEKVSYGDGTIDDPPFNIQCSKDLVIPEDSRCTNCCIYCDEADCAYRCKEVSKWKNEVDIFKNCTCAY